MESERILKKRILSQEDQTKCKHRPTLKEAKEINLACKTIIKEKLKIIYTNADQFTSSIKCELVQLILQEKPHIIAINEIKPKNGCERKEQNFSFQNFSFQNFSIFSTNINSNIERDIVILVHFPSGSTN